MEFLLKVVLCEFSCTNSVSKLPFLCHHVSKVSPMVQEEGRGVDVKVLRLTQRCVQMVHLDATKECLKRVVMMEHFDNRFDEVDYSLDAFPIIKKVS
ncbi:hypothetical protein HanIR_Chr10g0475971 [Helianthus annuus]|nr:hypothetical protein HanIR_Chr10g0475971 [Helianthus annuus]